MGYVSQYVIQLLLSHPKSAEENDLRRPEILNFPGRGHVLRPLSLHYPNKSGDYSPGPTSTQTTKCTLQAQNVQVQKWWVQIDGRSGMLKIVRFL